MKEEKRNVLGEKLQCCCGRTMTGFSRNGFCQDSQKDLGRHTVCAIVTEDFLDFTESRGNDLRTPRPHFQFAGLEAGDKWCLCVSRWKEALSAGKAPPVILEATHEKTTEIVSLEDLMAHRHDQ